MSLRFFPRDFKIPRHPHVHPSASPDAARPVPPVPAAAPAELWGNGPERRAPVSRGHTCCLADPPPAVTCEDRPRGRRGATSFAPGCTAEPLPQAPAQCLELMLRSVKSRGCPPPEELRRASPASAAGGVGAQSSGHSSLAGAPPTVRVSALDLGSGSLACLCGGRAGFGGGAGW